jgi:hypothetical protein
MNTKTYFYGGVSTIACFILLVKTGLLCGSGRFVSILGMAILISIVLFYFIIPALIFYVNSRKTINSSYPAGYIFLFSLWSALFYPYLKGSDCFSAIYQDASFWFFLIIYLSFFNIKFNHISNFIISIHELTEVQKRSCVKTYPPVTRSDLHKLEAFLVVLYSMPFVVELIWR